MNKLMRFNPEPLNQRISGEFIVCDDYMNPHSEGEYYRCEDVDSKLQGIIERNKYIHSSAEFRSFISELEGLLE